MNKALEYDAASGHICKMNPTEFHEFYMTSLEENEKHVRAKVDIEKTIVIHADDNPNNNTEDQSEDLMILIDIKDSTWDQVCTMRLLLRVL